MKSEDENIPLLNNKEEENDSTLKNDDIIPEKPEYLNETKEMVEWYKKWEKTRIRILLLVSFSALLAPALSTLFLPALVYITQDLNATEELVALTISIYLGVTGVFPLVWGVLIDRLGRKTILLISLSCTILTSLGCSFSWDIYALIVFRTLQAMGLCASAVVGAASISDVFPKSIRAFALGIWGITVLLGPVIGPLSGGIVSQYLGWRSIFRGAAIYAGINFLLILFFLPDTMRKDSKIPKKSCLNILGPLKLLTNFPIIVPCTTQGVMFSVMYFTLYLLPLEVSKNFNFTQLQNGLAFLPLGIGLIIGSFIGGRFADMMYRKYGSGGRMFSGLVSLFFCCIPINLFANFIKTNVYVVLASTFFLGLALQFGRPGLMSFGIERKPQEAASVSACFIFMSFGIFGFTITTLGPLIIEMIGIRIVYMILTSMILLASLLHFYIMYVFWGHK